MQRPLYTLIALMVLFMIVGPIPANAAPTADTLPTISIVGVIKGVSVTIQTFNFPPNETFDVRLGLMGTRAVDGIKVATISSGSGGSFIASFPIPASLRNQYQIAIRLQGTSDPKYYAYNWFYNENQGDPSTSGLAPGATYYGYPSFSILSVVPNNTVTIITFNLPPNDQFVVNMGRMGTRGINGIVAGTFSTGAGGSQTITLNIPPQLYGFHQIAVRIQSFTGSGYYAYNWFFNR